MKVTWIDRFLKKARELKIRNVMITKDISATINNDNTTLKKFREKEKEKLFRYNI